MNPIAGLLRGLIWFLIRLVPCALVGLLVVEGALRLGGLPTGATRSVRGAYDLDNQYPGPFRAGEHVDIFWPPELAYTAHFNSLGCRGAEPLEKQGGIICIGDSLTFCMGVDDHETWPQILNDTLESYSIVNISAPHLLIDDKIRYLDDALPVLKPRIVVLMVPAVGYFDSLATVSGESPHQRSLRRERKRRNPFRRFYHGTAVFEVKTRLRLWRNQLQLRVSENPRGVTLVFDEAETRALRLRFAEKLAELDQKVQGHGARLVLVPFPDARVEDGSIVYGRPWTLELAETGGYEHVDLVDAFREAPDSDGLILWPHDMHASPRGNRLIAERVHAHLAGGGG